MSEIVLVTGGAGFIGSHLAEELLQDGYQIRILDNYSTGNAENIAHIKNDIEIINGDICDYDTCMKVCKGISKIWHLAATGSVPYSIENPIFINSVNCCGTLNMLQAANKNNIERFIFSSSCSIYGLNENLPISESEPPMPLSPYAVSKLAAEYYISQYSKLFNMQTQIFRFFNIYGPRQDPNGQYAAVIPKFIEAMINNNSPVIFGDGMQGRDFVYVKDCAKALIVVGVSNTLPHPGEIYNLATGKTSSITDIFQIIKSILKSNIMPKYQDERKGDIKFSYGNGEKLKRDFNISPVTSISEGLNITCDWFASQKKK